MPIVIVVDAGVLAVALTDAGRSGEVARTRLAGADLAAPALVDLETTSTLRGLVLGGKLTAVAAERALALLIAMPIERADHRPLLGRCWELRGNLTVYDAAYVALAEALAISFVTTDARIERAPGPRCAIEVLSVSPG